jgi:hypothetical protein
VDPRASRAVGHPTLRLAGLKWFEGALHEKHREPRSVRASGGSLYHVVVCRKPAGRNAMRIQALPCSSRAQVDHRQRYHGAAMGTEAVRFLVLWMAGWIHSRELEVIDFLREENRVLREQLGGRRLRFTACRGRRFFARTWARSPPRTSFRSKCSR